MRWARRIGSFGTSPKTTPNQYLGLIGCIIWLPFIGLNIPDMHYVACWTEDDGVYCCGHTHPGVREAMNCLVPDGRSFIRAYDAGVYRSLTNREFIDFLEALQDMPWRRNKAQRGEVAIPSTVDAE